MLRLIAVSLWGASLFAGSAVATGLPVTASSLGAGTTALAACDSNGIALTYQLNASEELVSVTISNIGGGCAGGTARVTLTSGASVLASGTQALPGSGFSGSTVVTLSSSVAPSAVTRTAVAIDGV